MDPIKIYGRYGNVEAAKGVNQDTQSHTNLQPTSAYGESIMHFSQLQEKTNSELMDIAFKMLSYSIYGNAIKRQFKEGSGETLNHTMDFWARDFTGKSGFFKAIEKEIQSVHAQFHFSGGIIDVSEAIKNNMPSFRFSPFNLSEMIAIGGVQEVEVTNIILNQNIGYDYWDSQGNIHNKPHTTTIEFKILLKDWFGVDESDFTNFRPAALADRRGLAALWILQHQRGYKPFINVFEYRAVVMINLGVCY